MLLLRNAYVSNLDGTSFAAPHVAGLVALYVASHGRATNAAGVYRIRQTIIDAAQSRSTWQTLDAHDPDNNYEGLAFPSLLWVGSRPSFVDQVMIPSGFQLSFTTLAGYEHTIQYADRLETSASWVDLGRTNGNGAPTSVMDYGSSDARFYRLATKPALWSRRLAANAGSLGTVADGVYSGRLSGVPGAIAGDGASSATVSPVNIPFLSELNPNGAFPVEFWAKPGLTTDSPCLSSSIEFFGGDTDRGGWLFYQGNSDFSSGNGFMFRVYTTAGPKAYTAAEVEVPVDTNAWYHVVGVFDGTSVRLYLNGNEAANGPLPGGSQGKPATNAITTFGCRSDGAYALTGALDEATIYDRALSAAQVAAHYQAGTNASPPIPYREVILSDSPVGYWRFDEP